MLLPFHFCIQHFYESILESGMIVTHKNWELKGSLELGELYESSNNSAHEWLNIFYEDPLTRFIVSLMLRGRHLLNEKDIKLRNDEG